MLFCQYKRNANSSLKEVIRPDRKNVVFTYDALGRRIQKTYNKKITRWVWDGNTPLHEWIEASEKENKQPEGVITWVFDEGRFCPAARLVGDKAYSIITDYLGTPVQAYNESGKLKWETELDIYGKVRTFEGDKALIPFRYQGQYEDEETGLYYNRFRYYSPDEGIYLCQDPIGLSGGNPTLYGYVEDPNVWIDVFGLDCSKKVKVGDEIAPNSKVKRIKKGMNGKTIVIGRNMDDRVIPSAKNIDAEYWTGFDNTLSKDVNLANNNKWLEEKIAEGYTVVDIGLDPKYVSMGGVGSKTKGPYYSMETQVVFGKKMVINENRINTCG